MAYKNVTPALYAQFEDHCFSDAIWTLNADGTGATCGIVPDFASVPGTIKFATGSATNSVCSAIYSAVKGAITGNYSFGGSGAFTYEAKINIGTLANVTDDYDYYIGMNDGWHSAFPSNGCYFRYLRSSSANWLRITKNGGTETSTDTGIAVTTGWHIMRMQGTSSSVDFTIDGVSAGSNSTNLPTNPFNIAMAMVVKLAGTSSLLFYKDYTSFSQVL